MKGLLLESSEKSKRMQRAKAGMEEWREGEANMMEAGIWKYTKGGGAGGSEGDVTNGSCCLTVWH